MKRENMKLNKHDVKGIFYVLWHKEGYSSDLIRELTHYKLTKEEARGLAVCELIKQRLEKEKSLKE